MTGTGGPRAAFRKASAPRAASTVPGPRVAFREASGPRARRLTLDLVAAAVLAGCATGTTEADPGTPDAPPASTGTV
ncbi:hypothetical protein JS521_19500, partial [Streptomyces sp. RHZ10]|nr:hypothetical protein [Streptomyces durocortorensis]